MVKLETTKDRLRLHIGSYFVDLNETDYQELIRIFANEKADSKTILHRCSCEEGNPVEIKICLNCDGIIE